MDGERRAHMNVVHVWDAPDNLPTNEVSGQYPRLRWRPYYNCLLEHLVLLSSNTLYMVEYIHIHIRHTTYDTTSFPL